MAKLGARRRSDERVSDGSYRLAGFQRAAVPSAWTEGSAFCSRILVGGIGGT